MKIILNGLYNNLSFSSAHLIPSHDSCGGIHGHSYIIDVTIDGEQCGEFNFVVDFKKAKKIIKESYSKIDHKLLIPLKNESIKFKSAKNTIEFIIGEKEYNIPEKDCCLLDLESTSAEEMAKYFANSILTELNKLDTNINYIEVCVNESIGQGAIATKYNN